MIGLLPLYIDRSGQIQDKPTVAAFNEMSWERLFDLLDEETCARGKERVQGVEITERGLTIYFESLTR